MTFARAPSLMTGVSPEYAWIVSGFLTSKPGYVPARTRIVEPAGAALIAAATDPNAPPPLTTNVRGWLTNDGPVVIVAAKASAKPDAATAGRARTRRSALLAISDSHLSI